VDFTFTNVKTALAPGRSMIYVRCVAIPSMGGQVLIASVEKSPALPAQGTDFNAAQFLFAPSGLTSGGAALSLKGGSITSGGERYLLKLDGSNGYTGIRMDNISGNGYGVFLESTTNAPVFVINQRGTGTVLSLLQTTKTNPIIDVSGGKGVVFRDMNGDFPGLTLRANTTVGALQVNQSGGGNSAVFYGGAGVSIETITGSNRGMSIAANSSSDGLYINQTGAGRSALFSGGKGVKIDTVLEGENGLYVNSATNDTSAIKINQTGMGHIAHFSGGAGILIDSITDDKRGLNITTDSTSDGLYVNHTGTGKSARFSGGGGVKIENIPDGSNGLYVNTDTSVDSVNINQDGAGHGLKVTANNETQTLRVEQTNSAGTAAKFKGKVEIDGDLVVKGGNIILQSDADSSSYQITLRTGEAAFDGDAVLIIQHSSSKLATVQVHRAYVSDHVYWGPNQEAKIYYDSDGGSKGLFLTQNSGPKGHLLTDGSSE
jgi:hypothetical protein